ncbi:MAG: hypothetical protein OEL56_00570 [Nitrosopumilus sp.]|nr:hypothetical protein [Nitrosopumilus sp.]MDH3515396.1 hypothetical protein [Nitrosopumilus sp.]MDH3564303.1 hypothetical protein [Nitrosopumilus sp.]MDH5417186.1 hypothetical protein [Nitrosopumilus sp.]MDH5555027.1 hypothetical protein [Nitrosopumilus sp.]
MNYYYKTFLSTEIPNDLIYASFFFIDIVGLSNPILSTETQRTKIKILNELIYDCNTFVETPKNNLLILPTGDGMLIGFKNGLEQPLKLSIEFHKKLSIYNKNATGSEKIKTRIGCHIGHVFVVRDIYGNVNLWGPGAILSRRIMDMGDTDHILLSNEIVEDLFEISDDYKKFIHLLHNFGIKHGDNLLIYSAYGEGFGNSSLPKEKIKIKTKDVDIESNTICDRIVFDVIPKDTTGMTRFRRTYYFLNQSSEPVYEFATNFIANSKEELLGLNFKAYDEKDNELKISKVLASTPYSKKIIIKLLKPIFRGDSGKLLIIYDIKLTKNNFENIFTTDAQSFEINFKHYANIEFFPVLYYMDAEIGSKDIIEKSSEIRKGMFKELMWSRSHGLKIKDSIRLEW